MASRSRNRSNLRPVSREIIIGCVEGGLKALSLIDDNEIVTDVYHGQTVGRTSPSFIVKVEKEDK